VVEVEVGGDCGGSGTIAGTRMISSCSNVVASMTCRRDVCYRSTVRVKSMSMSKIGWPMRAHLSKSHNFFSADARIELDVPYSPARCPVSWHRPVPRVLVQPPAGGARCPGPAPCHTTTRRRATPVSGKDLHRLAGAYIPYRDHAFLGCNGKLGTGWGECGAERCGKCASAM
jgi:hypothetical protein